MQIGIIDDNKMTQEMTAIAIKKLGIHSALWMTDSKNAVRIIESIVSGKINYKANCILIISLNEQNIAKFQKIINSRISHIYIRIIVISALEKSEMINVTIESGEVITYVLKIQDGINELNAAVSTAARSLCDVILSDATRRGGTRWHCNYYEADIESADRGLSIVLTPRESETLGLILEGHANSEIARRMNIGMSATKALVGQLLRKFKVESRFRLQAVARKIAYRVADRRT